MASEPPITVVLATRDRRDHAVRTVECLRGLPENPPIVVVDDGSSDGTAITVRERFPEVVVVPLEQHRGVAAARNTGVGTATTPYVAFSDDDSWWAPGALTRAADTLSAHPRLALLGAQILVGDERRIDPTCLAMAASPLPADGLPGPRVLGFVACGAVVRREAFLATGGFPEEYVITGEEQPLALALAGGGWDLAYVEDVVARHAPQAVSRDGAGRQRNQTRNDLWTTWRHRRGWGLVSRTVEILSGATTRPKLAGVAEAVGGLPRAVRRRRPVPSNVESQLRLLAALPPHADPRGSGAGEGSL